MVENITLSQLLMTIVIYVECLIQCKCEVIVVLNNFFSMIKNQFGMNVKVLRSNNGTEFFNSKCSALFPDLGIIHQNSCPYAPQ